MVYILNRDAAARLTISSPLEAHKSHTLVYHTVGVDVGFENPMFACLEMDYEVINNNFFTNFSKGIKSQFLSDSVICRCAGVAAGVSAGASGVTRIAQNTQIKS